MTTATDGAEWFIESYSTDGTVPAMVEAFQQTVRAFGFDATAAGAWIAWGEEQLNRYFFNSWPADWVDIYQRNGLHLRDPIIIEARRRMEPFAWSESTGSPGFTGEGAEAWAMALAYGWREGYSVPVHGPGGYQGMVSLAALRPVSLTATERGLLRAICLLAHDRCRRRVDPLSPPLLSLTPRELECMRWVAAGKTDWEIAQLLGVSQPTAHFHVEQVKRKLALRSRTQAVALLILHGLI